MNKTLNCLACLVGTELRTGEIFRFQRAPGLKVAVRVGVIFVKQSSEKSALSCTSLFD